MSNDNSRSSFLQKEMESKTRLSETWKSMDNFHKMEELKQSLEDDKNVEIDTLVGKVEEYHSILNDNRKLIFKLLRFIIEEKRVAHENNLELDLRSYHYYCHKNIKMAKNMSIDNDKAIHLLNKRLEMYSDIYEFCINRRCKIRFFHNILCKDEKTAATCNCINTFFQNDEEQQQQQQHGQTTDDAQKRQTTIQLLKKSKKLSDYVDLRDDFLKYTPVIFSNIEMCHFNCREKKAALEEFESFQLCLILAATDSDFEKYFLFVENKLCAFRFKYRICISQSSIDYYLKVNHEFYREIEHLPFSLIVEEYEGKFFKLFALHHLWWCCGVSIFRKTKNITFNFVCRKCVQREFSKYEREFLSRQK
jgi:hypothetical protein